MKEIYTKPTVSAMPNPNVVKLKKEWQLTQGGEKQACKVTDCMYSKTCVASPLVYLDLFFVCHTYIPTSQQKINIETSRKKMNIFPQQKFEYPLHCHCCMID